MEERTTVQFIILTTNSKTKSLWDLICWSLGVYHCSKLRNNWGKNILGESGRVCQWTSTHAHTWAHSTFVRDVMGGAETTEEVIILQLYTHRYNRLVNLWLYTIIIVGSKYIVTHAHSYFKARKELRAIIYFIEKRTNYISNSAEIQCSSSSHQCSWPAARAIMSSHMVSRYVYCSYSCVCSSTVCMLHVHMN